ncbi:transcription elongation factor A protein 3-like isoform X1 [Ranitomeya variabilis]|uniref:transcription elongation factor A protein 3-like isoform X1 n=1 Tax=Ranitomeya variabilis TaxID=490064 RepID=UPI0040579EA7
MGTEEDLLKIGRRLEKRIIEQSKDRILDLLKELQRFQMTVTLLRSTRIGVTVNKLKKQSKDREIGELAKIIIKSWKRFLESSYKNDGASDAGVMASPTKTEPEKKQKEEKKLRLKNPCSESSQTLSQQPATKEPKVKCDCPENLSPSQSQHKTSKDSKIKRSHSTDVQSSSYVSKKLERRLSLNTSLPSSSGSKNSSNSKEERPRATLACSPTCSSPPSCALLSNSYATGDSVRDKCVEMIASALKTDDDFKTFEANCEKIAWEIEECIYKEIKATDMKYRNRIRSRISNLKDPKNPSLRRNVLCGVVSPQNIAIMTAEEMASDELKELRNTLTQEAIREHQMAKTGGTQTDLLQCDKCKKKNCTYNQVQTRSADEPMTTFVLCNECGHRWKFC